ncbi:MAG: DUF4097 domain-containing protein [Candidatus Krumholzibacteria bacterium]|nr:DUF4097 domain-containing protein [Candidatus Krumholzibacteria bacterium]MDH4336270.1 DUF4097 domain-containing protein [Candidatus Krumholzibacteria bacterium]MDH5269691.1 DUF4097 domain-containing protein [Candidatus Krumholzibacteria bacterium]MDH5627354.1 DUF4097 domain-containing protein [Candidatus Krumholzibacteria bacterium]
MKHGIAGLAPAVLIALTAVTAVATPGDRVDREEKRTVAAADKKELSVKNPRGRTVVVGKDGLREVTIVITRSARGRDAEDAARLLDDLEVEIEERGDRVQVETHDDGSRNRGIWSYVKGDHRSAWVDYTIEVPRGFHVTASTTSGEVRVSNIEGNAVVAATSGDIDIRAIGGDAEIAVTSGNVDAVEIGGDVELSATSGDVNVDKVGGKLELEGTSGDFQVTRVAGNVTAQLSSGDFVLEGCSGNVSFDTASGDGRMIEVTGSIEASTSSGDIEVLIMPTADRVFDLSSSSGDIRVYYVPVKNFGFQLDVKTANGSIEGDLPIKVSRVDRRRLQGVVGSGAARVEIETASGDVTIVEQGESASKSGR